MYSNFQVSSIMLIIPYAIIRYIHARTVFTHLFSEEIMRKHNKINTTFSQVGQRFINAHENPASQ